MEEVEVYLEEDESLAKATTNVTIEITTRKKSQRIFANIKQPLWM